MSRDCVRFRWNDRSVELRGFAPRTTLLDWLRLEQRATGTKEGCNEGDCGACTVVAVRHRDGHLNYEPINACIFFLGQLDGAELITVENLAVGQELHPVQAALARDHGSQCGFCTPGIVMSLFALYHGSRQQAGVVDVNDALAGNLCRCTGYRPIVDAAMDACDGDPKDVFATREEERLAAIIALADAEDILVGNSSSFFAAPAHEETLADLYQAHPDATVVAGATDVGLLVTKKLTPIEKILHVGRVASLRAVEENADVISFGAAVSLERVAARLGAFDPDIAEVMRRFGSRQVRASGTIGGNVANGSPIGDLAPILIVLGATVELQEGQTRRTFPVEAFFLEYGKQDRAPGEFVRRIIVPKPDANTRLRVFKVSKRTDEDISAVLGAFRFDVDHGRISTAMIAFGGMAGTPKRAKNVEQKLQGAAVGDSTAWRGAMDSMSQDFQPLTDMRASASYRLNTARNLLFKALAECAGAPSSSTRVTGRAEAIHVKH